MIRTREAKPLKVVMMLWALMLVCLPLRAGICQETDPTERSVISVESHVDRATITIGDRILYTVTVTSDSGVKLEPLALGSNLGAFEVKDYKIHDQVKTKQGKNVNKSEYLITTFTTGEYVIPPITVNYTDPEGERKQIKSEPLFILVKSVGMSEADKEDVRGLKPPIDMRGTYWSYLLILPILALLGAGGILYYRLRARGIALPQKPEEVQQLAWEVALFELDSLSKSDLWKKKRAKRYFTVLSDIVRRYLECAFEISVLDRTTQEIRGEMKRVKLDHEVMELTSRLLFLCDLVKFAKYVPSTEEAEESLNQAYSIVNLTKPEEEVKEEVPVAQE